MRIAVVLFLDEPTTGVDAVSRKEFWDMLQNLKKQGITILVSTPYMDEAGLCDKVALIQKGNILSINTPKAITQEFGKPLWAVRTDDMFRLLKTLQQSPEVESCYPFGEYEHVVMKDISNGNETLQSILSDKQFNNIDIKSIEPNIEDCFMALMNK